MNKEVFDPTYINFDYIFYQILQFFRAIFGGGETATDFFLWFKNFFSFLAVIFIVVILYCLIRIYEITHEEAQKRNALLAGPVQPAVPVEGVKKYTGRWSVVEEHSNSDRDADWRLAILEADAMLEEATSEKGFVGDTLGERLKSVSEQQFPAKQLAWDAHLVRNNIAHQGSLYELTKGEARQTIDRFKRVLETLGVL